jgi:hypothetical protein
MSVHSLYRTIFTRLEHLSFEQMGLLVAVIVVLGFICLRGFGSRSSY